MSVLSVALTQKKTLLIGGGAVAAQKARAMSKIKYEFDILTEEIKDEYFRDKPLTIGRFHQKFIDDYDIFIDASGDENISKMLLEEKKRKNLLINVVDKPELCDFYFCALASRGEIQVGVSSSGVSPTLAQSVRDKIEKLLTNDLTETASKLFLQRKMPQIDKNRMRNIAKSSMGKVFIIGCGSGDVNNLTLEALETFLFLEVAIVDAQVSEEILELLPKECKIIDASKQKGQHSKSQSEINSLLINNVANGKIVGRLKGGDPFIFGRLKEECDALKDAKIEFEVINGISSIFKAFNVSGLLPTIRDISKGVTIVSAHLRESIYNDDWIALLAQPNHTVVVLMAHSFATKIRESILISNINPKLPALFVSKLDKKDQKIVHGDVDSLEQMAQKCDKPAILILGECARRENLFR